MKRKSTSDFWPMLIAFLPLIIYGIIGFGYCRGIYKLIKCDFSNKTSWKPEILYGLGTVSGLGVVIGWFDLGE